MSVGFSYRVVYNSLLSPILKVVSKKLICVLLCSNVNFIVW